MKTLKFMLAAATAIGLASATQAAVDRYASTGFEKLIVGTNVTTGVKDNDTSSYFYYAGANAEDNESVIAAAGDMTGITRPRGAASVDATQNNILQVSTGTEPLLRTYAPLSGSAPQAATPLLSGDVYVDTLVQFTVTPYTDTVTPSPADKLMIYLKESVTTNEFGAVTEADTNLVVVGGYYYGGTTAKEYVLDTDTVTVLPNVWHRLTVKAVCDLSGTEGLGYPGFQIWVDGVLCTLANGEVPYKSEDSETADLFASFQFAEQIDEGKYILSLLAGNGEQTASLQGVGFAGEGKVDDIVFSDNGYDPFGTTVDFTLTWPNGLSPVSYTINGGLPVNLENESSPFSVPGVEDGATVTFVVANADGAKKTLSANSDAEGIDATGTTFGWAEYLGDAVSGAYEIDDLDEFILFQKGVASGLTTAGETFKQTADIDMGTIDGFTGVGVTNTDSASGGTPFAGTYDGQGHKIANVKFSMRKYAGIFNQVNGATIQNLIGENLGFSTTVGSGEHGCAMVGNGTATLVALKSQYTGGFSVTNTHNAGGIMVRAMGGTTFNSCTNTADLVCCRDKMGGICCFDAPAENTTVAFVNCVNTGSYTLVTPPAASSYNPGSNGFAGILGYSQGAGNTTFQGCENTGAFVNELDTTLFSNVVRGGEILGFCHASGTISDLGGNKFNAANKAVDSKDAGTIAFTYATVDNGVATTVGSAALLKDTEYLVVWDIASGTAFTLQAAGDTIAFNTALGYTFGGTVDSDAALVVSSATAGTVTTYTAATAVAQVNSGAKYATLKDAVDAAQAGDTVVVLADCTVATSVSFTKNVTVSNDYTIAANVNYALCVGATVTFEGSGMIQRGSTISGSAFCVGANEATRGTITVGTAGTLIFNGGTICGGNGGNQIKLENGTVTMNGGVLKDGLRGIKADADKGSYTSTIVINGGTITNCSAYAVFASAESATGKATITINGGEIAGPVGKAGKGDETITIPGTSTAKFNADQTAFCESGYETTLDNGWYVVTAVQSTGWVDDPTTVSNQTAAAAYPALDGTALANADAQKLTVWAKANSVAFNDATTEPADYVEAFLLNCAPNAATVAAEKEEFVLDISVAADGTVTVSLPAGKSYNGTLQMKGSNDLSTWTNVGEASSSYKFYKYELSL